MNDVFMDTKLKMNQVKLHPSAWFDLSFVAEKNWEKETKKESFENSISLLKKMSTYFNDGNLSQKE